MTTVDWTRVLDEAAEMGVTGVQFIGGEPTLHPNLAELVRHAVERGLQVEVFTNLVHVTAEHWDVFQLPGVRLATSYYSDDPEQHTAITGRPTHARTKANIAEARRRNIPLRAGVIDLGKEQRTDQARDELVNLGVPRIGYDRLRQVGRGAAVGPSSAEQLCGRCGDGVAAILPDGSVTPCVMSRWMRTATVLGRPLADAMSGVLAARARLAEHGMPTRTANMCKPNDDDVCPPRGGDCYPINCPPYR